MRPEKKWNAAGPGREQKEGAIGALFGWRRQNAEAGHKEASRASAELSGHDAARVLLPSRHMF